MNTTHPTLTHPAHTQAPAPALTLTRREAIEKLRNTLRIGIRILSRRTVDGVHTVKAAAFTPDGRWDESIGAVAVLGLTGGALAHAMLRAEIQAKERVTLSIGDYRLRSDAGYCTNQSIRRAAPAHPAPSSASRSPSPAPAEIINPFAPLPAPPSSSSPNVPDPGPLRIYSHFRQGSEKWHALRRGRPTASRFRDIFTASRGALSRAADAYIHELLAECLVPDIAPEFTGNRWTGRAAELEDEARAAFVRHTALDVAAVSFVTGPDGLCGCSPDGLIADRTERKYTAGLEIKCPSPRQHVAMIARGTLPDEYKQQVHGGMVITGLPAWHFWSWCPGMRPLHILVHRDEYTDRLAAALGKFVHQYQAAHTALMPRLSPDVV